MWREIEYTLITTSFEIPVYFAFENSNSSALYDSLQSSDDMYKLVVKTSEATKLEKALGANFQVALSRFAVSSLN